MSNIYWAKCLYLLVNIHIPRLCHLSLGYLVGAISLRTLKFNSKITSFIFSINKILLNFLFTLISSHKKWCEGCLMQTMLSIDKNAPAYSVLLGSINVREDALFSSILMGPCNPTFCDTSKDVSILFPIDLFPRKGTWAICYIFLASGWEADMSV